MYMDSTCYTIMYNYKSVMYNEPRHELYYTGPDFSKKIIPLLIG